MNTRTPTPASEPIEPVGAPARSRAVPPEPHGRVAGAGSATPRFVLTAPVPDRGVADPAPATQRRIEYISTSEWNIEARTWTRDVLRPRLGGGG
jgi:hypothetical protein